MSAECSYWAAHGDEFFSLISEIANRTDLGDRLALEMIRIAIADERADLQPYLDSEASK